MLNIRTDQQCAESPIIKLMSSDLYILMQRPQGEVPEWMLQSTSRAACFGKASHLIRQADSKQEDITHSDVMHKKVAVPYELKLLQQDVPCSVLIKMRRIY